MRRRTAAAGAHRAESVGIVHQQTERELLLQRHDLVQFAAVALHAEDALGDDQHAAALLFSQFGGVFQLQAQRLHVVVGVHEPLALVQTQTVHDAGVRFGIVNHHVERTRREQAVDDRDHALIAEIEQEGVLLAYEGGQLAFQLLVIFGLAAHHAGTHRSRHAELGRTPGIGFAHLRMIGEAQIVIQTPIEHHLPAETHVRPQFSFELRKSEITVCHPHVLTDRAARIFFETGKNIHHILFEF